MARRVRRPKDKEDLFKNLIDEGVFATFREVLVFAAALGVAAGRRVAFDQSLEPIPWEVFANSSSEALMDMIAAAASEDDADILADDRADDRLTIFEENANGGLEVIRERLANDPRPALDVVLEIVLEHEGEQQRAEFDIASILP